MSSDSLLQRAAGKVERGWLLGRKYCAQRLASSPEQKHTVFVAGVQRSGTNMMMDVLERSLQTDVYHERDPRAFANYRMREPEVIRALHRRSPASHFVIKALCELQHLRALMADFAPARTLWVIRHYDDVVNSMLVSFRNHARQVKRVAADRLSDGWKGEGMSDETHALVRELVTDDIDDASAAAIIWYFRNVLFFEQGFDTDERVMALAYERLVTDPQRQFERIFHFLELDYTRQVSARIFASSVRRREPPPIRDDVRAVCDGLLRRFEPVLAP